MDIIFVQVKHSLGQDIALVQKQDVQSMDPMAYIRGNPLKRQGCLLCYVSNLQMQPTIPFQNQPGARTKL